MPNRDSRLLIEDIATAIFKIEKYTAALDRDHFLKDDKTKEFIIAQRSQGNAEIKLNRKTGRK